MGFLRAIRGLDGFSVTRPKVARPGHYNLWHNGIKIAGGDMNFLRRYWAKRRITGEVNR